MAGFDEILELEDSLSNYEREYSRANTRIGNLETKIKRAEEDLAATKSKIEALRTNKRYLREEAPVVKLEEFATVKISLESYEDRVRELWVALLLARDQLKEEKAALNRFEALRQEAEKKLSQYRQLLPFKRT